MELYKKIESVLSHHIECGNIDMIHIDLNRLMKDIQIISIEQPSAPVSAEEIIDKLWDQNNLHSQTYKNVAIEAMEEYASQFQSKPTDTEIEEYANGLANALSKNDFQRGEWLGIKEGAKALRDGKIKRVGD